MKKIWKIIFAIFIVLLLIPIPLKMKDGGSVEYKAILYSVTDVHRIKPPDSPSQTEIEYYEGIQIKILGFEIFNNIK